MLRRVACTRLPTKWGVFHTIGFQRETCNGIRRAETAVALVLGEVTEDAPFLRIHSQCLTGESLTGFPAKPRRTLTPWLTCRPKGKRWGTGSHWNPRAHTTQGRQMAGSIRFEHRCDESRRAEFRKHRRRLCESKLDA